MAVTISATTFLLALSLLQNPPGERVSALQDGRRRGPASPGVTAARVVEASVGAPETYRLMEPSFR